MVPATTAATKPDRQARDRVERCDVGASAAPRPERARAPPSSRRAERERGQEADGGALNAHQLHVTGADARRPHQPQQAEQRRTAQREIRRAPQRTAQGDHDGLRVR